MIWRMKNLRYLAEHSAQINCVTKNALKMSAFNLSIATSLLFDIQRWKIKKIPSILFIKIPSTKNTSKTTANLTLAWP